MYDSAARVQEIADLKVKNVRLSSPAVITLHGKGDKTRQVPILGKTKELLTSYLEVHKKYNWGVALGEAPLFFNQRHQPLSRWGISYILDKYVCSAQKDIHFSIDFPITPHVLRQYGEKYKMVSDDRKPAKPASSSSIHSPFYH